MATHIKVVGILHIVLGAFGLLAGFGCLILFGGLAGFFGASGQADDAMAAPILGGIGGIIFLIALVLSLPGIVAGIGLLQLRPWGRTLGIVFSALDLFNVPFGTALGIYGLWALLSPEGEALFRRAVAYPAVPQYPAL